MGDISLEITLEITRGCPLNCLICSSNGGSPHPHELSLEKWLHIIDESIDLGAKFFLISGGEPFSVPYFKEICEYISSKDLSISIYTCGNVLKEGKLSPLQIDDLDFISNFGAVRLVFNLQGMSSKTHDTITQVKGSFENTLSSIIKAVDYKLTTEIHFVPTLLNYKELQNVVSLSKNLGVEKVSVLRFVAEGRGKKNEPILKLKKDDLASLKDILSELEEYEDFVRVGAPFSPFLLSKNYKCTAGRRRMTIRYDGRVVPCEAMKFMAEKFEDNDVRRHSLKDIWETSQIFQLARKFQSLIQRTECNSCSFFNKCGGGCPVQRLLNGALEHVDPYCQTVTLRAYAR